MSESPPIFPYRQSQPLKIRLLGSLWLQLLIPAFLPLSCLLFFMTGPHSAIGSALWILPVALCILCDYFSISAARIPRAQASPKLRLPFLYGLAVLHWVNILLMLAMISKLPLSTPADWIDAVATLVATRILLGTTACCSGVCVAHELLHKPDRLAQWLGRSLLWTVLYDHFAVEHILGHHKTAGTPRDPATARFGESYRAYWRRSVPEQFLSAWRLESERLRKRKGANNRNSHSNRLAHRVLQGLIAEGIFLLFITIYFGWLATAMFIYQAVVAVRLLEAVNYFQHWGLLRTGKRAGAEDAWTTDSWFTEQAFLGLSNHAYHHQFPAQPWYRLQRCPDSPMLPHGYFVMMFLIRFNNPYYRRWAAAYLRR